MSIYIKLLQLIGGPALSPAITALSESFTSFQASATRWKKLIMMLWFIALCQIVVPWSLSGWKPIAVSGDWRTATWRTSTKVAPGEPLTGISSVLFTLNVKANLQYAGSGNSKHGLQSPMSNPFLLWDVSFNPCRFLVSAIFTYQTLKLLIFNHLDHNIRTKSWRGVFFGIVMYTIYASKIADFG